MQGKASKRKLRLFACACCRRVWHTLEDRRSRWAVEIAEQFADGESSSNDLDLAWRNSWKVQELEICRKARLAAIAASSASKWYDYPEDVFQWLENGAIPGEKYEKAMRLAEERAQYAASSEAASSVLAPTASILATRSETRNQAELLRDLIGNPFRPVSVEAAWLTRTVISLGTVIYEERPLPSGELEPCRLAVLADALEDAGCTDTRILGHLRSPGPHVRGCWALDLLLNKQ